MAFVDFHITMLISGSPRYFATIRLPLMHLKRPPHRISIARIRVHRRPSSGGQTIFRSGIPNPSGPLAPSITPLPRQRPNRLVARDPEALLSRWTSGDHNPGGRRPRARLHPSPPVCIGFFGCFRRGRGSFVGCSCMVLPVVRGLVAPRCIVFFFFFRFSERRAQAVVTSELSLPMHPLGRTSRRQELPEKKNDPPSCPFSARR